MPLAPGHYFDYEGKTLFLPRLVQGDKDQFHAWANWRALADMRAQEHNVRDGLLTSAEYEKAYKLTHTRVTTGYYAWSEEGGDERLFTVDGLAAICWYAMRRHDAKLTYDEVRDIARADRNYLWEQFSIANAAPATGETRSLREDARGRLLRLGFTAEQVALMTDQEVAVRLGVPLAEAVEANAEEQAGIAGGVPPEVILIDQWRKEGKSTEECQRLIDERARAIRERNAGGGVRPPAQAAG